MQQLTGLGLESILQRSHFITERKNKYSFSKSKRFPALKSTYTIDYFNTASPRMTRACSFGYGNKYDMSKGPNHPCASAYQIPSQKIVGLSFGMGREKIRAGDYLSESTINKNPSSNKYNPTISCLSKFKTSPKSSLGEKHSIDSFILPNFNPEPNKYNVNLEKEGRVTVSNFKTAKKTVFGKSSRFLSGLQQSLIGPGQYNPKNVFDSRRKSEKNNVFAIAAKKTFAVEAIEKSITPGPIYYVP